VDEQVRHVLRARAEMKHGKNLREGINGQPERLCGAAHQAAQFVQLKVRDLEIAEGAFMQDLRMLASAR
jgi:hypothetical protein